MANEGRHRRPVDARDHPADPCNRRAGEVAPPLARNSSCLAGLRVAPPPFALDVSGRLFCF
jgi:hypothetical protein